LPGAAIRGGRRSIGDDAGEITSGASPARGSKGEPGASSVPLLSRLSLTGMRKASPGGGVSEYLRRHSSEGVHAVRDLIVASRSR